MDSQHTKNKGRGDKALITTELLKIVGGGNEPNPDLPPFPKGHTTGIITDPNVILNMPQCTQQQLDSVDAYDCVTSSQIDQAKAYLADPNPVESK